MKYTIKEWKAEAERRFGDFYGNWKFTCPACGRVNTGREFMELGAQPNEMYQTCIGRHNGNMRSANAGAKEDGQGCDWAAFGFFGTLGKGDIVVSEDGTEVDVFAFAESEVYERGIEIGDTQGFEAEINIEIKNGEDKQ